METGRPQRPVLHRDPVPSARSSPDLHGDGRAAR
jgi:hypothetical protein